MPATLCMLAFERLSRLLGIRLHEAPGIDLGYSLLWIILDVEHH
jgi:hypothetical protein